MIIPITARSIKKVPPTGVSWIDVITTTITVVSTIKDIHDWFTDDKD